MFRVIAPSGGRFVVSMKIVFVSDWYSERMGYLENCLPRELAAAGAEVHLITSQAQVYFDSPDYDTVYRRFLGDRLLPPGTYKSDGVTIHRLPLIEFRGRIGMRGLGAAIRSIDPDVVQILNHTSLSALQVGWARLRARFRLFSANHVMASVFPPPGQRPPSITWKMKTRLSLWLPGRLLSILIDRCYAISPDAADLAERYFGVPTRKIEEAPLGVDTKMFHPVGSEEGPIRSLLRRRLSVGKDETLCIYTGRFSPDKDPLCLAQATNILRSEGNAISSVFVGEGPQKSDIEAIDGCSTLPFVPFIELPNYYRAADLGVWPRQESTSVFDAKASGLPVVGSDRVEDGRFEQGGAVYREGDARSLADVLRELLEPSSRAQLGEAARRDVMEGRSWKRIAGERLSDYERALER